jgi:hypothetical protein
MSYQLTERPHKFSFSKNPIRYLVEMNNPDTPGCAIDIELYLLNFTDVYDAVTNPGELITTQRLTPDPDGKVFFYCEDFLNSQLEWDLPGLDNNDILASSSQLKRYYIRYRQSTTLNPSPAYNTDADSMRIVLKGGVAKEKFDRNNFFVNYLPAQKPFLTWQPKDHFIGDEERRYLTYFHHFDSAPDLLLKAVVIYTDGTNDTATVAFPLLTESLLFHCPAGLDQLGLLGLQPTKQIWYYTVSVEDAESNIYATGYRLYVDYRKFYDVFSFIYHNSLSGVDTLRIRGDYDIEIQRESTDIEKATGGDFSNTELPTEIGIINISKYEKYTGDAGWMNSRAQQDSLQDLLLSDNVFRVIFGRWLRVINMQKTQPMPSKDDTKFSFPLQWRYTFNNTNYTPADKDFGAGSNDEDPGPVYGICTAPSNLVVETANLDPSHCQADFTWDPVDGAMGYEFQYKKSTDTDWITLLVADPSISVNLTDAGDYQWRVRTQCAANDYSSFTDGNPFTVDFSEPACTAPASLSTELLSLDTANGQIKFSWPVVGGVVSYILEWKKTTDLSWNSIETTNLSYIVYLEANSQWQARIKSKCSTTPTYSGYVYANNFTPSQMAGTCNAPGNLQIASFEYNDFSLIIQFNWNLATGAQDYELQYRQNGTTPWNTVNHIYPGYTKVLPRFLDWQWRVRSNCTAGGSSGYTNGALFST